MWTSLRPQGYSMGCHEIIPMVVYITMDEYPGAFTHSDIDNHRRHRDIPQKTKMNSCIDKFYIIFTMHF
jgi:hypothetical protein